MSYGNSLDRIRHQDVLQTVVEFEATVRRAELLIQELRRRRKMSAPRDFRGWLYSATTQSLLSPYRFRINLTDAESRMVRLMAGSSDGRVSKAALAQAMLCAPSLESKQELVVTRLRAKCAKFSVSLPIVSERGKGYIFIEPIDVE